MQCSKRAIKSQGALPITCEINPNTSTICPKDWTMHDTVQPHNQVFVLGEVWRVLLRSIKLWVRRSGDKDKGEKLNKMTTVPISK